ncbi:hypothetical protein RHCRD62_30093 [Rhodococcus sp. RD6.2]|nr:hypothetical protein RHCRD62_30093 [Rhodococcus sp. RD6.2]
MPAPRVGGPARESLDRDEPQNARSVDVRVGLCAWVSMLPTPVEAHPLRARRASGVRIRCVRVGGDRSGRYPLIRERTASMLPARM